MKMQINAIIIVVYSKESGGLRMARSSIFHVLLLATLLPGEISELLC